MIFTDKRGRQRIQINDEIRGRIAFAHHNLVADGVFCEVNLVMCRNVLIYFDRTLQRRVVSLFHDSLVRGGYLCLGNRESLQASGFAERFRALDKDSRIFRKEAA